MSGNVSYEIEPGVFDPYAGAWETRYSQRGLAYQVWQPAMPWIHPDHLRSVVYLYPSEADAEDGKRVGGSGFLAGVPVGDKRARYHVLCVVTNKHVIDKGGYVVRINTIDDRKDVMPLDDRKWFYHPDGDDLAVCPIRLSPLHSAIAISTASFITKEIIEAFEIGPGDETFLIGRFVNHEGRQRNLPTVRFGNIAQMPWEPIIFDGLEQESFLVESRSISGYSGSPVYVYLPPPLQGLFDKKFIELISDGTVNLLGVNRTRANIPVPMGPWLLGIDYCHIRSYEKIWRTGSDRPVNDDWFVKGNTGMMGVIPAWRLRDILDGPELKPIIEEARLAADEAAEKDTPVELDTANLDGSSDKRR